jgi:hypothetical protein
LCVEERQTSIGVAVHRFGNVQKFFLRKKFKRKKKKIQRKEWRSVLRGYKGIKKPPLCERRRSCEK